jgi:hypothetical protein
VNLKIKSTQCFGGDYRGRMCVRIFIEMSDHTYMNIYVYIVFLKKESMYQKKSLHEHSSQSRWASSVLIVGIYARHGHLPASSHKFALSL